jgi:hypothetical protein
MTAWQTLLIAAIIKFFKSFELDTLLRAKSICGGGVFFMWAFHDMARRPRRSQIKISFLLHTYHAKQNEVVKLVFPLGAPHLDSEAWKKKQF